jgi:hypothetical protein
MKAESFQILTKKTKFCFKTDDERIYRKFEEKS